MSPTENDHDDRVRDLAALNQVRRRVAAIGFLAVAGHGIIALPLLAHHVAGEGRDSDAVVLIVAGAFLTLVSTVATRVILGRHPITWPWVLPAVVTPSVAAVWIWG